jgi:O-antigen ligase
LIRRIGTASVDAARSWRTSAWNASEFDRAGLAAIAVLTIWPLLNGGWGTSALVVACAGVFAVSRLLSSSSSWIVPAFLLFGLVMVAAIDPGGLFSESAGRGPFGYANAKAAMFVQGSVAAVMLAIAAGRTTVRRLALGAAFVFSVVPLVSGTVAASLTLVFVVGSVVLPRRLARQAVTSFGVLFVVALLATAVVGIAGQLPGAPSDDRRVTLWSEAVDILAANPVLGGGAFSEVSATAASDADASWAHNEFLQLGAEHGIPALAAAVFLVLWVFVRLRRAAVMSPLALPGAAAVAALTVHACVDYVGHFALIPMFCAALVGAAVGAAEAGPTGTRVVRPLRSTPA